MIYLKVYSKATHRTKVIICNYGNVPERKVLPKSCPGNGNFLYLAPFYGSEHPKCYLRNDNLLNGVWVSHVLFVIILDLPDTLEVN